MKPVRIEGSRQLRDFIAPMTATLSDDGPFNDAQWLFELKWDGYRAISEIGRSEVRFYSRNGIAFDKAYVPVYKELQKIKTPCVLDGEVVLFDETGKPSFQLLQNYPANKKLPIMYYVFDCLSIGEEDITGRRLEERKAMLSELIAAPGIVLYSDHVKGEGEALFEQVRSSGLEGIIAKRADSKYYPGRRTKDWLKIKNILEDDFVIVGFTEPQGSRQYFGSLLLASREGDKLIYRGNVGTGYTVKDLKELHQILSKRKRASSPLSIDVKMPKTPATHWVDPVYVCQIKYTEITSDGHVRHPVFLGLRVDKI